MLMLVVFVVVMVFTMICITQARPFRRAHGTNTFTRTDLPTKPLSPESNPLPRANRQTGTKCNTFSSFSEICESCVMFVACSSPLYPDLNMQFHVRAHAPCPVFRAQPSCRAQQTHILVSSSTALQFHSFHSYVRQCCYTCCSCCGPSAVLLPPGRKEKSFQYLMNQYVDQRDTEFFFAARGWPGSRDAGLQ